MASKVILFDFSKLESSEKLETKIRKDLEKYFTRAGAPILNFSIAPTAKRTSGISYREVLINFKDNQSVTLRVKSTGDIYQVLLNNSVIPITNQDDHAKAIGEIANKLAGSRTKFQEKLTKAKVEIPASIKTPTVKLEAQLTEKRDNLVIALNDIKAQITDTQNQLNNYK